MAFSTPPEIYEAAVENGAVKAGLSPGRSLVGGALAGAFIAFGGLLAVVVSAGLNPDTGVPALVTGAAFSVGLMLVVLAGAELVTGNVLYLFVAAVRRRASWASAGASVVLTTVGAFAGALFVAYFLAVKSGVMTQPAPLTRLTAVATLKGVKETDWQIFLRGIGCNWLVCLAVWMALAAKDVAGKILAIFFPIMAFVAMGFDHVVANMFFLPAAHFAGAPVGWGDIGRNLLFAGLGNAVGAVAFVGCAYTFLYAPRAATGVEAPRGADRETVSVRDGAVAPAGAG